MSSLAQVTFCVIGIMLIVALIAHKLAQSATVFTLFLSNPGSSWPSVISALPQPPKPYHYDEFMTWLKQTDFSQFKQSLKWQPEVAEFDIDAAAQGKFGPWLTGSFADSAIAVAKSINKYSFMDDILLTGNLDIVGAPGTHLYVLRRLLEAAQGSAHPTFVDAGCGPGYLLMAWILAAGEGSRAVGIDVDQMAVASAERHLRNAGAFDTDAVSLPRGAETQVFVGDALNPDGRALGLRPNSVDAINLGLAVEFESAMEDLSPLAQFLRTGGLMAAPVCNPAEEQPSSIPKGKCAGLFKIFVKSEDGSLQRAPLDPDIPTRFIVALKPGQTTGDANGAVGSAASSALRGKR